MAVSLNGRKVPDATFSNGLAAWPAMSPESRDGLRGVILWLPWLLFRFVARRPAGHKAWMSQPCRPSDMNAASTPYAGAPAGAAPGG